MSSEKKKNYNNKDYNNYNKNNKGRKRRDFNNFDDWNVSNISNNDNKDSKDKRDINNNNNLIIAKENDFNNSEKKNKNNFEKVFNVDFVRNSSGPSYPIDLGTKITQDQPEIVPESKIKIEETEINANQNNNNNNTSDMTGKKTTKKIEITNIPETTSQASDVTTKNRDENTNNNSETPEVNKNEKIFTFDKNIIESCIIDNNNISEDSSISKILSEYTYTFFTNISSFPSEQNKILFEKKATKLHPDIVFDSYENNIILPVSNDKPLERIKIKEENFDEIEKINNIIEGNKNINVFDKNEIKPLFASKINLDDTINNFQKMMNNKKKLFEQKYNFDKTCVKKLKLNLEDKEDNNNNIYLPSVMHTLYEKKHIQYKNLYSTDDLTKKVNFPTGEENTIENNTIYALNIRNINKLKFTRGFKKAKTDKKKLNINISMISSFMDEINELYEESNVKSFKVENASQKCKIDEQLENILTEIHYSFKNDNNYSTKNNFDETFTENSNEDIHLEYSSKYFKYFDLYDYSNQNDIDILDDIDINSIHEQFKIYKSQRSRKKNKYLCGGEASIELMKTTFTDDTYNKSQTRILHNLSNDLNKISNITNSEEIKNIANKTEYLSQNGNHLRSTKKLKNELNRSIISRYAVNSKNEIINKSDSDMLSLNKKSAKSDELGNKRKKEKNRYENMMKKIKKTNDDINKTEKRMYNNKLKAEQENNFQNEIKKERMFKFLYTVIVFIIPLSITLYNKFTQE